MAPVPLEIWILLVVGVLVAFRTGLTLRRRGWRRTANEVSSLGWQARWYDWEGLPVRFGRLALMRHGYNRRARSIIVAKGKRQGRSFCYHVETGFGKAHASHDLTVAVIEGDTTMPGARIGIGAGIEPSGAFWRYHACGHVALRQTEEGGKPAEASARAAVYAESPRWAETVLRPVLEDALKGGVRTCEVRGPFVALYQDGIIGAQEQLELLKQASALTDRLETASGRDRS